MRKNNYSAFTLVEMLIVMGILIILMAIGITAGRFAINRANDVAHQNAVDKIFTAAQAYYTDNREFPAITSLELSMSSACGEDDVCINQYLEAGEFDGGTDATYYYQVQEDLQQEMMICVSLGGVEDQTFRGFYCNGNGFGSSELGLTTAIDDKNIENAGDDIAPLDNTFDLQADWEDGDWAAEEVV
jgi:Tfp pilus assembly protein PilE